MKDYYLKFDYPWANMYHVVEAKTLEDAIEKFIKGTRIPATKVKVWKAKNRMPAKLAGRRKHDSH